MARRGVVRTERAVGDGGLAHVERTQLGQLHQRWYAFISELGLGEVEQRQRRQLAHVSREL
jgi:hypothetical protein